MQVNAESLIHFIERKGFNREVCLINALTSHHASQKFHGLHTGASPVMQHMEPEGAQYSSGGTQHLTEMSLLMVSGMSTCV